jgi:tetratricopeptide (TPR) repeat protein
MLNRRRNLVVRGFAAAFFTLSVPIHATEMGQSRAAQSKSAGQGRSEAIRSSQRRRTPLEAADARQWQERRRGIERALKQDRLSEADAEYRRHEPVLTLLPNGAERAAWWMLGAKIHYRKDRFPQAVLSAMKVVILAPRTGHADEGLCWAAQAYEKLGRPNQSVKLYRECLDRRDVSDAVRSRCKRRLAALTKGESPS